MVRHMLTDTAVSRAKTRPRRYKLADRDGLYLAVLPTGKKVFRYEYRFHTKRETLTLARQRLNGKLGTELDVDNAAATT